MGIMKKYLSLLKNSKLFQGISEDEFTSMLNACQLLHGTTIKENMYSAGRAH